MPTLAPQAFEKLAPVPDWDEVKTHYSAQSLAWDERFIAEMKVVVE